MVKLAVITKWSWIKDKVNERILITNSSAIQKLFNRNLYTEFDNNLKF